MLQIDDLVVEYELGNRTVTAVRGVSLAVEQGEFFTFLGPSGCGKTTTLRSVAGLETPTGGAIRIDGAPVFSAAERVNVPTQHRDISMVFQSYAIWPHMSVAENVAFPLHAKGMKGPAARAKVEEVLAMVGLADYGSRPATQLSGGQQQRVAVARAMVKEAKILLLDEPLSNLDAKLREQMRRELRDLQARVETTAIYVTHDQEEALALSDRIAVMDGGLIVEQGAPVDLYLRPRHPFTARFIGQADLMPATAIARAGEGARVSTALGEIVAAVHPELLSEVSHVLVRPESVEFVNGAAPAENVFDGTVVDVLFSGSTVEYAVAVGGARLAVHAPPTTMRQAGDQVRIFVPPERCVLLSERVAS